MKILFKIFMQTIGFIIGILLCNWILRTNFLRLVGIKGV